MSGIRIALTKGRLQKDAVRLFEKAGYDVGVFDNYGRKLVLELPGSGIEIVLAKAPDVITYVEHGVCDLGVAGKDTIMEAGRSFYEVLDLGFGRCRFVVAAKEGDNLFASYRRLRIATKYPNIAARYFWGRQMDVEIIRIEGSVELAPILGLADGIVDIVETGGTLQENGLVPVAEIAQVSARMIVNLASMKMKKKQITTFLSAIEAALGQRDNAEERE